MPSKRRMRRRRRGVPAPLVAAMVVAALIIGGVGGYFMSDRLSAWRADSLANPPAADQTENPFGADPGSADGETQPDSALTDDDVAGMLSGDQGASALYDAPVGDEMDAESLLSIPVEPVVVAEYDDVEIMSTEVIDRYNELVGAYLVSGFGVSDSASELLEEVLRTLVEERIGQMMAQELGLYEITEDDTAAITLQAETTYEETVEDTVDFMREDDMTDEQARQQAIAALEEEGVTLQSLTQLITDQWWNEKLYDHVTSGVEVTDEKLEEAYAELLETQQSNFDEYHDDYEYDRLNDLLIVYNPAGYRTVKHIYLEFEGEAMDTALELTQQLDNMTDEDGIDTLNAQLDALYQDLEEKADAIIDRLNAGESFDALLAEFGMDDSMTEGITAAEGYYISSSTVLWSDEFVAACMALDEPGDISQVVRSDSGVHIILYFQEVAEGAVPLEDVRDELTEEVLQVMRDEVYEDQMDAWLEDANVAYYPERLQ